MRTKMFESLFDAAEAANGFWPVFGPVVPLGRLVARVAPSVIRLSARAWNAAFRQEPKIRMEGNHNVQEKRYL